MICANATIWCLCLLHTVLIENPKPWPSVLADQLSKQSDYYKFLLITLKVTTCVWTDRTPVPLTPVYENKAVRYADGEFDDRFNRVIVVREGSYIATLAGWLIHSRQQFALVSWCKQYLEHCKSINLTKIWFSKCFVRTLVILKFKACFLLQIIARRGLNPSTRL